MAVLVTGANGFVGSHLVDGLLRAKEEVRVLVRASSNLRFLDTTRVQVHHGELARGEIPREALSGVDRVFHVAAILKGAQWETFRRVNVDATLTLYRRFSDVAPAEGRFIFVSSLATMGPAKAGTVYREEDDPHPHTLYGRSKLEAEVALAALSGPALTVIRPPAVYGPRDTATLPLFTLAERGFAFCVGSAERLLSLIHVQDLVDGLLAASEHRRGVGTFFLTDGQPHSWRKIGEALANASSRKVRVLTLPDWLVLTAGTVNDAAHGLFGRRAMFGKEKARDFCAPSFSCSSQAASDSFGYRPRLPLVEGMETTMDWYRREGWL
jgi:nucleoside-diphosphate-sugar epimerase